MIDTKRQSRAISADMSPQAIEHRLRTVAELNQMCRTLAGATVVPREKRHKAVRQKSGLIRH
jgi:hypothetical protein